MGGKGSGGKRPRAGRPRGSVKTEHAEYVTLSISMKRVSKEMIKAAAAAAGKSVSRFLVDAALG